MSSYYVVGGEYADTSFTILAAGTEREVYGPFNERDAKVRWRELTGKTVDNAMVRYFLKSEDEITGKSYWVVGGEYANSAFTTLQSGKELEVYGPFENWEGALGFWRGLTSKSVDDALVRYDIRENYQPGDDIASRRFGASDRAALPPVATKSIAIAAAPDKVIAYLKDVGNWPRWASRTFKAARPGKGGVWEMDTSFGPARLTLKADVALGVIDHVVVDAHGHEVAIPGRVVPLAGGAVFMMTFAKPATISDAQFTADLRTVDEELAALKRVLESP